jgi:peptidoglycan/xylan/chitin deacetylase (PgdA/CDA1 family)
MIPGSFVALIYHDVHPEETFDYGRLGRSATMYHVSRRAFLTHLDVIKDTGLSCLDEAAMRGCFAGAEGRNRGSPGVVLCFDDGWRGAFECAAPALAQRGMPAFFFVTTDFVGRRFFASSDALRRLDPSLFTIGSHGVTHRMLSALSSDDIHAELADSRNRLEDLLGRPVTCLSVPGGATDSRVLDIAATVGYEHVFTSALGMNPTADGRRGIARIGVRRDTNPTTLRRWLRGDLRREEARAAVLAVPKRLLGMRTYSRLRRLLLGEAIGREHVFEP